MIQWYLNRLKTFSVAEFPYRIRQLAQKKLEQYFFTGKKFKKTPPCETEAVPDFYLSLGKLFPDSINLFGKPFNYSAEIDWHKDIFSGESFPRTFSKSINIRSNPSLSAKNVWEVNRMQFLPHIAFNYRETGDKVFLDRFMAVLNSWIDDNPFLIGVNWYSNIEINIRLINWFICWQAIDADTLCKENKDFKLFVQQKWIPLIYSHCRYSFKNPSKYSSSNNHLIAEYAGLFIASSVWKFDESKRWLEYSRKGLEKEIQRQHDRGVNKEEAAEYIQFITDFFLLPFLVAERSGNHFTSEYKQALFDIFQYINNFLDCRGNFPKYGDEDDGRCFILDSTEDFNNFRSLLISAAILFNDNRFKKTTVSFDTKNLFLFGLTGKDLFERMPLSDSFDGSAFYKEQGHFIFRKKNDGKEIYLHFDAAPLGFLSIAAHGHADALSFMLHLNGNPLFIDSGTYTYHTEPEWRSYFIGTLAHNTIRINRKNQALSGGPTLWLNHFKTSVIDIKSEGTTESVKASHNGYRDENINHIREIFFNRESSEFIIYDTIELRNETPAEVEIPFHLHPDVDISVLNRNNYLLKSSSGESTNFIVDEKLSPEIVSGVMSPRILGWYSESFCKKRPTQVIYSSIIIKETTTFKFEIKIS